MGTALIKPKKISQSSRVNSMGRDQINEICGYLGWTETEYFQHQFEQYEEFLKRRFHGCPQEIFNTVRYSPLMRGLWNNEWIHRNRTMFLEIARFILFEGMEINDKGELMIIEPPDGAREQVFDDYCFAHNGKLLVGNEEFMMKFNNVVRIILENEE